MRLRKRRRDITASIEAAARASAETAARLAETRDLIATQRERARSERTTIIASLKRMRETNNLARMLLDTVERDAHGADGSPAHQ
jgi:ABC-type transporter Mla subunit MlaD